MKDNAHAESRVLSLFHLVIILIVILILMAVFLNRAIKVRDEALTVALLQNTNLLRERTKIFQQRWFASGKPTHWVQDDMAFPVTSHGWLAVTTDHQCVQLWIVLLSTRPEPLIQHVSAVADGCLYSAEIGQITYDFKQEHIFLKK